MTLTDFQKRLVLDEKEQHLRQLEIYTSLAKSNIGWFGDWNIEGNARKKIRKLMHQIDVLDTMLSNDTSNPLR